MRRVYDAESAERERVQRTLTAALESEPDLEFAWLYGSFLSGAGFRDVDVGVHLTAPPEVRFRRGLALAV
jgi:predicted nucleotidyltransferase